MCWKNEISSVVNTSWISLISIVYRLTPFWVSHIFSRPYICIGLGILKSVNRTPSCPAFTCFWKTFLFNFCRIITEWSWLFCFQVLFLFQFMFFNPILRSHSIFSRYICWLRLNYDKLVLLDCMLQLLELLMINIGLRPKMLHDQQLSVFYLWLTEVFSFVLVHIALEQVSFI